MVHTNSLQAYRRLNLTAAQKKVARAILNETHYGRAVTMDGLFRKYGIMPTSSGRITELKAMAKECQAFVLDGEEYALVCVGKEKTAGGDTADAFKLEKFAVVRAAWLERNKGIGEQVKLNL